MANVSFPAKIRCGLAVALMLCAASIATAADKLVLRIGGTGNALGTMRLIAEAFARTQPKYVTEVLASIGSSGAIRAVPKGAIQIGLSSRPLTDAEASGGIAFIEYARSPTVFAVRETESVKGVTRREVAEIYAGRMTRWPDGSLIRPVMRQPGDDNMQQVAGLSPEIANALAEAELRPGLSFASNDQEAADKLESIQGGFGVSTVALIRSEKRRLRALALDGVEPSIENAQSGRYPMLKRFYLITPKDPTPAVREFIAFVKSPSGASILKQAGHMLP